MNFEEDGEQPPTTLPPTFAESEIDRSLEPLAKALNSRAESERVYLLEVITDLRELRDGIKKLADGGAKPGSVPVIS